MVNFRQVSKYLDGCLVFGIKPGLERIEKILQLSGNPHRKIDFIHIVGTNGKTSTTKMVAGILNHHNIPAGYHISPHIKSYTERMWIRGKDISENKFAQVFDRIYPFIRQVNKMDLNGPITQFEIISAMAFKLAEDEGLEVMVLEAGMGGRWDATNAAYSKVVGLTGVSLEHTKMLGSTIREIVAEKVEVIKKGAMVATTTSSPEVLKIITKKTNETGSKLFCSGKDFGIQRKLDLGLKGWSIDIKGVNKVYRNLKLHLLGQYQPLNLSLAVVLSELYLGSSKKRLAVTKLNQALPEIRVRGRFEIIRKEPVVVADAAHNPEGIENFAKDVMKYFGNRKKIIIFSVLKDKDYKKMIEEIIPVSDVLILTSSLDRRSLNTDELEKAVRSKIKSPEGTKHPPVEIYRKDDIKNSMKFALKISGENDIICITGSITNLSYVIDQ
jgi:dihydrofolate synthase/folylpolyglutamate synthase